jgi:hypothetical protein
VRVAPHQPEVRTAARHVELADDPEAVPLVEGHVGLGLGLQIRGLASIGRVVENVATNAEPTPSPWCAGSVPSTARYQCGSCGWRRSIARITAWPRRTRAPPSDHCGSDAQVAQRPETAVVGPLPDGRTAPGLVGQHGCAAVARCTQQRAEHPGEPAASVGLGIDPGPYRVVGVGASQHVAKGTEVARCHHANVRGHTADPSGEPGASGPALWSALIALTYIAPTYVDWFNPPPAPRRDHRRTRRHPGRLRDRRLPSDYPSRHGSGPSRPLRTWD